MYLYVQTLHKQNKGQIHILFGLQPTRVQPDYISSFPRPLLPPTHLTSSYSFSHVSLSFGSTLTVMVVCSILLLSSTPAMQ